MIDYSDSVQYRLSSDRTYAIAYKYNQVGLYDEGMHYANGLVIIKDTYEGVPVTKLNDYFCDTESSDMGIFINLQEIKIPSTIAAIGSHAFDKCWYIETLKYEGPAENLTNGKITFDPEWNAGMSGAAAPNLKVYGLQDVTIDLPNNTKHLKINDNTEIAVKHALCDMEGNIIHETYIKDKDYKHVTVDQQVVEDSEDAVSGKAVYKFIEEYIEKHITESLNSDY